MYMYTYTSTYLSLKHRAYLKSVAKKLAEDVDNLKTSASTIGRVRDSQCCRVEPHNIQTPWDPPTFGYVMCLDMWSW